MENSWIWLTCGLNRTVQNATLNAILRGEFSVQLFSHFGHSQLGVKVVRDLTSYTTTIAVLEDHIQRDIGQIPAKMLETVCQNRFLATFVRNNLKKLNGRF